MQPNVFSLLRKCSLIHNKARAGRVLVRNSSLKSETPIDNEKIGMVEKWKVFWKDLIKDYSDVLFETIESCKTSPQKTVLYGSLIGVAGLCFQTNPDFRDYRDRLLMHSNERSLVAKPIRNPKADNFITSIENCCNLGVLRRLNFGIFSVIWFDNYSNELGIYQANCSYLKPQYINFNQRIVDIGFLSKWWRLDKIMEDYDVNEEEWTNVVEAKEESN